MIEKLTKGLGRSPNDLVGGEDDHSMNGSKEMLDQTIRFLQGLRATVRGIITFLTSAKKFGSFSCCGLSDRAGLVADVNSMMEAT